MRFYYFFVFLLLALPLHAFSSSSEVAFKVIHTTDIHGALFPFDFINNRATDYGLAQVSTYVNQERAINGQRVILLDGGDILQGQPTVYYANHVDSSDSHIVSRVMNFMNYDAATIGNHDIGVGPAIYNRITEEIEFPWLVANIIDTRTGQPFFKPYHTVEHQGVKVAILGLTTPTTPQWLPDNLWQNMEFIDMVEAAQAWMDTILRREAPHVVIGLFHAGHNGNSTGGNGNGTENGSLLVAQSVPGFDIILMGHSHECLDTTVMSVSGEPVRLLNPGPYAMSVSSVTITVKLNQDGGG